MSSAETLVERLRRRAKEDQACADNSAVIVDALAGQMKLFNAHEVREDGQVWNTYAVRMAVDHQNSVKRDTQYASDLLEAAAEIEALRAARDEALAALEPFVLLVERQDASDLAFLLKQGGSESDMAHYAPDNAKVHSSGEMQNALYLTKGDFRKLAKVYRALQPHPGTGASDG